MTFRHEFIDLPPISSDDTPNGRYYFTSDGKFPSVTTVIGWNKGDKWLKDWRARVGNAEADRISGFARTRGTAVHALAEKYLLNDPDWKEGAMPANLFSFLSIRGHLDRHLGTLFGVETPLWSPVLRTAGRTDLIAEWDGIPSVIDFKTSRRVKKREDITGYFVQKTCYGEMIEERVGLEIPQIVTVMMVDHEEPLIFVEKREDHRDEMLRVFMNGIRKG